MELNRRVVSNGRIELDRRVELTRGARNLDQQSPPCAIRANSPVLKNCNSLVGHRELIIIGYRLNTKCNTANAEGYLYDCPIKSRSLIM